jgi:flagellar biosynthesis chaperone FliJ
LILSDQKFEKYRRQIENSRSELTKIRNEIDTINAERKDYEKMLSTEQDPSQKKFYQQHLLLLEDRIKIEENRMNAEESQPQKLKFLDEIEKGNRMAIFTLTIL